MIRCLLVHITRNQRGQAIRKEIQIAGDEIQIGRAPDCKIHLLDNRVNMHHAVICHSEEGRLVIEGEGAALNINGIFEQHAGLWPGTRILIGPYSLVVEAIHGNEKLTISYELINPLPDSTESPTAKAPLTLDETGLSKRRPALLLAALIALFFLILPIAYALNPALHKTMERLSMALDHPWSAGQMSPGHRALSVKCNVCHQQPFRAVADQACAYCHGNAADHIADKALQASAFRGIRCAECHLDHRGKAGLVRHDTPQCVVCHGNIKAKNPKSALANIHDFSLDHPAFQVTVRAGPGERDIRRVRQTDKAGLAEKSGLKFSHQVHFEKALIELPQDQTREIQCEDCHRPDDAGARFEPMTIATCQQSKCHALNFTPIVEGRQIPHGSEKAVMAVLREFYASKAIGMVYVDGVTVDDLRHARNWAYTQTEKNAGELFLKTGEGTCLECHEITPDPENKETPWKVAPVRVTDHWLPKSSFPHSRHETAKCTECHDVEHSDKSADVNIPTIRKCRECHVGSKQAKTRVSSSCDTCHNFHGVGRQL